MKDTPSLNYFKDCPLLRLTDGGGMACGLEVYLFWVSLLLGVVKEFHMGIWTFESSGPGLGRRVLAVNTLEITLLFSWDSGSSQLVRDPTQEERHKLFPSLGGRPTDQRYRTRKSPD